MRSSCKYFILGVTLILCLCLQSNVFAAGLDVLDSFEGDTLSGWTIMTDPAAMAPALELDNDKVFFSGSCSISRPCSSYIVQPTIEVANVIEGQDYIAEFAFHAVLANGYAISVALVHSDLEPYISMANFSDGRVGVVTLEDSQQNIVGSSDFPYDIATQYPLNISIDDEETLDIYADGNLLLEYIFGCTTIITNIDFEGYSENCVYDAYVYDVLYIGYPSLDNDDIDLYRDITEGIAENGSFRYASGDDITAKGLDDSRDIWFKFEHANDAVFSVSKIIDGIDSDTLDDMC